MADSIPERPSKRLRRAITIDQKKALRAWSQSYEKEPSHVECMRWWNSKYGDSPRQSTISELLSKKYAHLDTTTTTLPGKRERVAHWPELEEALFEWEQLETAKQQITLTSWLA